MDDSKLRALLTAVQCGSFGKAAVQLGYTQSAMTHLVSKLEAELGCTLLLRSSKGVCLSEEGEHLLPYIHGVINACETYDGYVRFFSRRIPDADIHVTLTLMGKGGDSNAPGNVSIGQGLKRDESGAIAVSIGEGLEFDSADALTVRKDTVMTSDDLLNEEETKQEIAEMLK